MDAKEHPAKSSRDSERLSILKPQKQRNPLSDIDLSEPAQKDASSAPRRVSFANSNFIKEFATDPEKNTIWDSTYEEAINKSADSPTEIHKIQSETIVSCVDMSLESIATPPEPATTLVNCTKLTEKEMDLTYVVPQLLHSTEKTILYEDMTMDLTAPISVIAKEINDRIHMQLNEDAKRVQAYGERPNRKSIIFNDYGGEDLSLDNTTWNMRGTLVDHQNLSTMDIDERSTLKDITNTPKPPSFVNASSSFDDTQHLINYQSDIVKSMEAVSVTSNVSLLERTAHAPVESEWQLSAHAHINISQEHITLTEECSVDVDVEEVRKVEVVTWLMEIERMNAMFARRMTELQQSSAASSALDRDLAAAQNQRIGRYEALLNYDAMRALLKECEDRIEARAIVEDESGSSVEMGNTLHVTTPHLPPIECDMDLSVEAIPSLHEQIAAKCKEYRITQESVNSNCYVFHLLHKGLYVKTEVIDSKMATNTEVTSHITENATPDMKYAYQIVMEKLTPTAIKSAIGNEYDILSLLDFVYINGRRIVKMMRDFDQMAITCALTLDNDFVARFKVASLPLRTVWAVHVNMADHHRPITDQDVTAHGPVAPIDESAIRKLIKGCPIGFDFLSAFIDNIRQYRADLETKLANKRTVP